MDDDLAANECRTRAGNYFLSADAYCCEFEDGAIILDMRTVAYLGIDAEHLPNLRACVQNWPNSLSIGSDARSADDATFEALTADLLNRGILTTTPSKVYSPDLEFPTTTLAYAQWDEERHPIPITHILEFAASLLLVTIYERRRKLGPLLAWIRRHQEVIHRRASASERATHEEILVSFLRLRIWCYTAFRRCLFDSLVLSVFLTRRMVPCTLVIGVSTKPFAAHSWVQIRECVLNDSIEYVQSFAPILAIGQVE
jgi:hypothetical protein